MSGPPSLACLYEDNGLACLGEDTGVTRWAVRSESLLMRRVVRTVAQGTSVIMSVNEGTDVCPRSIAAAILVCALVNTRTVFVVTCLYSSRHVRLFGRNSGPRFRSSDCSVNVVYREKRLFESRTGAVAKELCDRQFSVALRKNTYPFLIVFSCSSRAYSCRRVDIGRYDELWTSCGKSIDLTLPRNWRCNRLTRRPTRKIAGKSHRGVRTHKITYRKRSKTVRTKAEVEAVQNAAVASKK